MNYDIKEIRIGTRKRGTNSIHVAQLADSIAELGLLNPITITADGVLVAGFHRLEACKRLGLAEIAVNMVTLDQLHAELAEIDENIIRDELTELEEAVQIARRKEIYEALHPQTKNGMRNGQTAPKNDTMSFLDISSTPPVSAFALDTAEKTGQNRRTIERKTQIGEALAPVAERLHATPVADNQSELLSLARMDAPKRERVIERIEQGTSLTVRDAEKVIAREDRAATPRSVLPPTCPIDHADNADHIVDGSVDLVFVDPPYNISDAGKVTKVGTTVIPADFDGAAQWDTHSRAEYLALFDQWAHGWARVLRPGGVVVTFCDRLLVTLIADTLEANGLVFKNTIIWHKTNAAPNSIMRRNLISSYEEMVLAIKPGPPFTFNPSDLWDRRNVISTPIISNTEKAGNDHPTQKPLAVLKQIIDVYSNPGDLVLDTHAGSGSIGVAALQLGRRVQLIEQDADYVRLAEERIAAAYARLKESAA